MGVDGGYLQVDVEELARVFTGWTICKKAQTDLDDATVPSPLDPCIEEYWLPTPVGQWVADFRSVQHDCGSKTLFAGTPEQAVIPATCDSPSAGYTDVGLALDAIAAHPSTPRFISRKILERFVTDEPTEAMIDVLEAAWNNGANPAGVGDLEAVLAAALGSPEFLDPDRVGSKVKTPLEHFIGAMRAIRGDTDGVTTIISPFLVQAQHLPHYNAVPTGWPENGDSWIGTNNTLTRQNFGMELAASNGANFGSDPIGLLNDGGVTTAPGNAEAIVTFLADVLFAGALTPAEHQQAVDFLNTDDGGVPAPYNNNRIRDVVGLMLGYPQFQEQ